MMATRLNGFEQFLVRFETLISSAKGEPARVKVFWDQSPTIRDAADALDAFLYATDFERRVFHGPRKYWPQAPIGFDAAWREYKSEWAPQISNARFGAIDLSELIAETPRQPMTTMFGRSNWLMTISSTRCITMAPRLLP
jgi:hypothetical protein